MDIARTNLMNYARALLSALLFGLIISPFTASASDIDIYSGLTSATGAPNVLIIMDNAANFTSNFSGTVCTYTGGGVPSLGGTNPVNGSIEQCALNNVIQGVQPNADGTARINIGLMVYNGSGIIKGDGTACNGGNGGCLLYPLTPMTAANKAALQSYIQGWSKQAIGSNGEATAETMQEAWNYLHGGSTTKPAPSGTVYGTSPISQSGCQKTYVVFIANALGNNGTPGEGGSVTPGADLAATIAADSALTSTQKSKLTATIQIPTDNYGIQGVYNCSPAPYIMGSHSESSGLYADEWAEFMAGTDLFTGAEPPNKSITTYTIGVLSPSCVAIYPALLKSMARQGNGNYYAVQNAADLENALASVFNEVQAVNSVFSSATLPVSVNTQGTYLNQLYMGMFRPDQNGSPRWVGNVKQYQFAFDQNNNLYLADATGQPAISAAGTGFITTQAASFWTCTNTTQSTALSNAGPPAPYIPYSMLPTCSLDPATGFWANNSTYANFSAGGPFDLMDGEIVEKGGAAQSLRLENLTDDYTLASGTGTTVNLSSQTITGNPRRLYTFCPAGMANCPCTKSTSTTAVVNGNTVCASLTDPVNSFGSDNTALTSGTNFGSQSPATIATLTESGGTVTATTTTGTNFASGDTVTISGATPNDYNGTYTITVTASSSSSTTFTYHITENPPLTATGSYMLQAHQPTIAVSSITRTYTMNANPSPNPDVETATVTTGTPHGYATGNTVVISGGPATESAYNGQHTITVTGANTFTYPVTITPPATGTNTYTVSLHNKLPISITTISLQGSTATVNTGTAHNFNSNDLIQISNTSNTCFQTAGAVITWASSTSFTYSVSGCGGNKTSTGGYATPVAANQAATMKRTGTYNPPSGTANSSYATATLGASNFATGDLVDITYFSGSATNEALYTGTSIPITCTSSACTTFTYPIVTNPVYPGSSPGYNVSLTSASVTVSGLTRSGTTATANLAAALSGFTSPGLVDVFAQPGTTAPASEAGYQGTFTGTCQNSPCTTITYGPITLSPAASATGSSMKAVDISQPPQAAPLINWVRGADNLPGDEQSLCSSGSTTPNCPNPMVTVRPSIHGDALHSRPIAVNFGGTTGVIVFYGTNDGVYHAINGNQPPCNSAYTNCPPPVAPQAAIPTTITDPATGTQVPPGDEIWGFIAPDFYAKLNRQRANSPPILLPGMNTSVSPTPQPKDYFIDGPTGLLQEIDGNGNTVRAIIYVGARRGGHLLYALDVTDPFRPRVLWKIDNSSPNMSELGQTWSLPKVGRVDGYVDASGNPVPVLIMGAGYDDGSEDAEPPVSATSNGGGVNMGSDNIGRGIYVLDAFDGHVIWQARHYQLAAVTWPGYWERATGYNPTQGGTCNGTPPAAVICDVGAMNYSMPADVTLMDKDGDGYIDRFYATDTGGNVWRVDLHASAGVTPDKWQITELAALGCPWGPCSTELTGSPNSPSVDPVPTQRKFFFPAEVIGNTSLNNYDAVFVGSGDREHPLQSEQAYNVVNRMYMIKDFNTGNDSVSQIYPVTEGGSFANTTGAPAVSSSATTCSAATCPASLADCTGGTCITAPLTWSAPNTTATGKSYDKLNVVQQGSGYYFTLGTGEKVVNAPLTTAGYVYFGTNQPVSASTLTTCQTNLGIARGYQLAPFSAQYANIVFAGGGLPPSPVSGIVDIQTAAGTVAAPFCVGCPSPLTGGNDCTSALAACKPTINVPATRHRNYWYLDNK